MFLLYEYRDLFLDMYCSRLPIDMYCSRLPIDMYCTMYCPRKSMKLGIGKRGRIVINNFKWRTERFKNSPISYAISKYNEK